MIILKFLEIPKKKKNPQARAPTKTGLSVRSNFKFMSYTRFFISILLLIAFYAAIKKKI